MSLGSGEIFIIVILALLLFGPDKLPELARQAARVIRDVRRAADEVKSQFNILGDEEDDEPRKPLASMRDKINERDDGESDEKNEVSSTRNEADDPYAHRYGDEICADDTYFINDKNGASSADNNWNQAQNDWRTCGEDIAQNDGAKPDYSSIEYSNSETDAPMTAQERKLFGTAPTASDEDVETPRDTLSELELRITPTTSVARSVAPNRVRVEDNKPEA